MTVPACSATSVATVIVESSPDSSSRLSVPRDRERAARMLAEPCTHDLREERGHRDPPECPPALDPLLLADGDRQALEVEVVDPGAEQLAPPRPGVGGEDEHRVDERVPGGRLD